MLQACDLAIQDSSERVVDLMVGLLEFFTKTNVITPDQFERVSNHIRCFQRDSCIYRASTVTEFTQLSVLPSNIYNIADMFFIVAV